ncbi:protein FAM151A [Callorhinchus milii]|uniref:protein FAM151A n=1 Tax=Callorhinchus milii TaxID=7868 RepID=UPI001C3FC21D|nr:protein FAM151A [Callorhinchus milii]XP_042191504.1 protein FAM151A [Callorhinchus milii]
MSVTRCRSRSVYLGAVLALLSAAYLALTGYYGLYVNLLSDDGAVGGFSPGGNLLDYCLQLGLIPEKDAIHVTWAHGANSLREMEEALRGPAMVLEADVTVEGLNTQNQTNVPIMAHPPAIYSDNTLQHWLNTVTQSQKGIKLDFKSLESLSPSLDILTAADSQNQINQPVWLNADILRGPNVPNFVQPVNASRFLALVQEKFPTVTVSPGWLTLYVPLLAVKPYTQLMVEEMAALVRDLPQRITFPVRAVLLRASWLHFSWLLSQSPRYSLTLWQGEADPITVEDLLFIREHSDPQQIYYDIYEPVLSEFKNIALHGNRDSLRTGTGSKPSGLRSRAETQT